MFGHVRGAFTGADENRRGLFEAAENGTLFLDEIADTPVSVQVKLLRVLESRRFSPVGTGEERVTSARFIAATHRNIREMIAAGTFREDLYHRLSAFTVHMPPLRDRSADIPVLLDYFLRQLPESLRPRTVSPQFSDALQELARRERYLAMEVRGARHDLGIRYGAWITQLALGFAGVDREVVLSHLVEQLANQPQPGGVERRGGGVRGE